MNRKTLIKPGLDLSDVKAHISLEVEDHPLKPVVNNVRITESYYTLCSAFNDSFVQVERVHRRSLGSQPSTGRSTPVLTPIAVSVTPALDPLSQFAIEQTDPLSQMAAQMVSGGRFTGLDRCGHGAGFRRFPNRRRPR